MTGCRRLTALCLAVIAAGLVLLATPATATARHCDGVVGVGCGVGANPDAGDFQGLIAVDNQPWVLNLAGHSGTRPGCDDCAWSIVLACAVNSPGDPSTQAACVGSGNPASCPPGELLYRLYLTTDAVVDELVGTLCLGGGHQPVEVGVRAKADVRRYLRNVTPPDLDISTRPRGGTLAGLATSFTASPPASLSPVDFGGPDITETITLTPSRINWRWGDGSGSGWVAAGSTLLHSYLSGGIDRVSVSSRWGASYTISYQGATLGPYTATGQITRSQRRGMVVHTSAPTLVSR
jgi:hypothetical protein